MKHRCMLCTFKVSGDKDDEACQLIMVLHVITAHPDVWLAISGESAEAAAARYQEYLRLPEMQEALRAR